MKPNYNLLNLFRFILILFLFFGTFSMYAQESTINRKDYLAKAEKYKPNLLITKKQPVGVVEMVEDASSFQNYKATKVSNIESFYRTPFRTIQSVTLDFGEHITGYLEFHIKPLPYADAPIRLKLTFGELPAEMATPFDPYKGTLSRAWLQDEIITVDALPTTVKLPRRYSFRYLKIELLGYSDHFDFIIDDMFCNAGTSAGNDLLADNYALTEPFEDINAVSLKTLRECMQTVFEDGPKRDRRIWIGDFKLQALANYYSFKNIDLVKRGLYLFAATADSTGLLYGTLFERPFVHPEFHHPIDYCLLYNTILSDYYEATSDKETIEDLWQVAKDQINFIQPYIDENGIFSLPPTCWNFIDWNPNLDKQTSLQGIAIYTLECTQKLAEILGREKEVAFIPKLISKMKKGSRQLLFDKDQNLFVSGPDKQISVASQVWMILSDVVSVKEASQILITLNEDANPVKPVSPYMYHYYIEALIKCGMYNEAKVLIALYWGGMVAKGADTFWEVYDPDNDFLSPYNSFLVNSACHAWSCTPVYLFRKYYSLLFSK